MPEPALTANEKRKTQIHTRLAEILAEYGGIESNIPASRPEHEYWTLKAELRQLNAKEQG